jgi:hypothetical protein
MPHQRYLNPSNDGSADYDTAKKVKNRKDVKFV